MITSIVCRKGGVGKTTVCVNLAAAAYRAGARVLVIDLDSQGSASKYLLGTSTSPSSAEWAEGSSPWHACTYVVREEGDARLDLMPGNTDLDIVQLRYTRENPWPVKRLRELTAPLRAHYDYVLIDCHPGEGPLEMAAAAASDVILCPVQLEPLAVTGLEDTLAFIERWRELLPFLPDVHIVPTRYDGRVGVSKQLYEAYLEQYGAFPEGRLLHPVRYAVAYANGTAMQQTVFDMEGSSAERAREDMLALFEQLNQLSEATHERQA